MTIVAWDGKTLAADKAAASAGYLTTVTKIFRLHDGCLICLAGDEGLARELLTWFEEGCQINRWPDAQRSADDFATVMLIDLEGRCLLYGRTPYPAPRHDPFIAMGCGRDYALAAMYLGRSACQAVEVACALDISCGKGIDTLELE